MPNTLLNPESEYYHRLKWLMFFRVLFTSLLLGSTIILQLADNPSPLAKPLLVLYGLIAGIFLLSFFYAVILPRMKRGLIFASFQIGIDSIVVTLIIFVTGSFSSIFSFLYLVVIIYSSMLLYRGGTMVMAALCSIQYGIMVDLEYFGIINPYVLEGSATAVNYPWTHVVFKVMIIMVACFAVAFLSSLLSEQVRKTKKELLALEDRVKRVEKLAYMGQMAAGMAHEIKNPLASLAGSIQILKGEIDFNADHEKLMQIVLRETDRLSALANNFLLFAKPPTANVEKVALDKALAETVGLFKKDGNCYDKISIETNLAPDIWVEMDPMHLSQVLWNLLLNAAESIEDKGVVEISMYPLKQHHVEIRISDNGCGISQELMKSIFDPFFTTKPNGTGLGLSIVHSILESYSTWLDVESKVDQGTTIILRLKRINSPT